MGKVTDRDCRRLLWEYKRLLLLTRRVVPNSLHSNHHTRRNLAVRRWRQPPLLAPSYLVLSLLGWLQTLASQLLLPHPARCCTGRETARERPAHVSAGKVSTQYCRTRKDCPLMFASRRTKVEEKGLESGLEKLVGPLAGRHAT